MAKTVNNIADEAARRLGDINKVIWPAAVHTANIIEGYIDFCQRTEIIWARLNTAEDVAHQALYVLPADIGKIERISYKGVRIEPISRIQAMLLDQRFETTEGQVVAWMFDGDGPLNLRKIRIPSINGTVGDTQIEYFRIHVTVATTFEIPDYMTKYLRFYDMGRCYEREGEGQSFEGADHYLGRFEQGIAMAIGRSEKIQANRVRILGGREGQRPRKPARPVLPSNFPQD